jgi:type IV secretion system protein VirB9
MPAQMKATESPALLVIGDGGKEELVNYRVRGDRYIVDLVFDKAVLISGVGRQQTKVTITRLDQSSG